MSEYLLLFTIGPVQSFIAKSRKMRDLYAGSFILSYLITHVCEKLETFQTDMKIERIIPVVDMKKTVNTEATEKNTISAPNRILLKVSFSNKNIQINKDINIINEQLKKLANFMEKEVRSEFREIYEAVFNKTNIEVNEIIKAQLDNFLEVFWATSEYKGENNDFEKLTTTMQAVKTLRVFSQTNEEGARKCSLFPEYNAIFYKCKDGKKPNYLTSKEKEVKIYYALKAGEALCSPAFVKRMLYIISKDKFSNYRFNENIISVASMLLQNALANNPEWEKIINNNRSFLEASEAIFDLQSGQALSEEEYESKHIEIAKNLFRHMQDKKIHISPYYAVIKFDGDNMGSFYRNYSKDKQQKLSLEICEYAKKVWSIIQDDYKGKCIYAGGEDFLGFLPATKALPALIKLRQEFQNTVKHPEDSKKMTFSAGIVIAHLMPPLKNVLEMLDNMEYMAKENPGKNSFAIAVLKRSGTQTYVCNHFGEDCSNINILCKISSLIEKGVLSVSSVYNLLSVLDVLSKGGEQLHDEMVESLIISSICPPTGKAERDIQNAKDIFILYKQYDCKIKSLMAALEIATFLGKEELSCITK